MQIAHTMPSAKILKYLNFGINGAIKDAR